jgi:hypothetical protein
MSMWRVARMRDEQRRRENDASVFGVVVVVSRWSARVHREHGQCSRYCVREENDGQVLD